MAMAGGTLTSLSQLSVYRPNSFLTRNRSTSSSRVCIRAMSETTSTSSDASSSISFSPPPNFKPPEPKRFGVRPDKTGEIFGALLPLIFRFATGVFVSGYSFSFVSKDEIPPNQYALELNGNIIKETSKLGPRPEKPIEIYEFESCPFCRKVREIVAILDLDVLFYPCPRNSPNFRPKVVELGGKQQFPYTVDPNTGVSMYESDDIIRYLVDKYGDGSVPLTLSLGCKTVRSLHSLTHSLTHSLQHQKKFEMGLRNMEILSENHSSSLNEALLYTTMCIIGHPVDVHVKDGSVYSGIFFTASVDADDYGIVLKNARMIMKGKGSTNVANEGLVDTLVILSDDLVQVVAKGAMLHADGVGGNVTGNKEEAIAHNVSCSQSLTREADINAKIPKDAEQINQSRQAGDDNLKGKADNCRQKSEFDNEKNDEKIQSLKPGHEIDIHVGHVEAVEHGSADMTSSPPDNGLFCNDVPASVKVNDHCSERSTSADSTSTNSTQGVDLNDDSHISAPRGSDSTRSAKGFKLNPAAKIFSPTLVNTNSAPFAVPTTANMVYIPNSSPAPAIATIQPEVGFNAFASRPSVPVKVAQYSNLTMGNAGSGSQFSQPIVGQLTHRTQPLRYAAQYTPVLSEPAYLQTNSPAVMVGRSSQLIYVQPVSHDMVHGATAISPLLTRPLLNHVQFPKHQGGAVGQAMSVCMPPPVLTSGQQSFPLQSHYPVLQPGYSIPRPISVPGPNGFYGNKF